MKHLYSAGVVVYTLEKNTLMYLLLQHSTGHWDFPKGKIESGETKQEAALRELHEESGLNANIDPDFEEKIHYFFTDYDKQHAQKTVYFFTGYDKQHAQKTVYFFTGKALGTHVQLSYEHTDFAWLSYHDALKQLTYENAKNVLKKVHKHITHTQKSVL